MRISLKNTYLREFSSCLLALLVLSGCKEDKNNAAMIPPPPQITVVEVKPGTIPLTYEYAGRIAGSREVEVRARVSGILLKRVYVEGQRVKEGDVLFKIDPEPLKATLAQAEAKFHQTESNWNRVALLYKEKAVSGRERDEALSIYEQAKAELRTARINLNYTTVKAPITGVTSKEALSEGSLVQANSSLLTRISQLDPTYVNFAYPDAEALRQRHAASKKNQQLSVMLKFGDGTTYPHEGQVDFTDSIIDTDTGTVQARAVAPNPESTLMPGQFVRVMIKGIVQENALAIPDQAVMQGPQGTFVYTVNAEGKAAIAPVTLGVSTEKGRIIEKGLKPGDRVIVEGLIKVRPDQPVQIDTPSSTPATTHAPAAQGKKE